MQTILVLHIVRRTLFVNDILTTNTPVNDDDELCAVTLDETHERIDTV